MQPTSPCIGQINHNYHGRLTMPLDETFDSVLSEYTVSIPDREYPDGPRMPVKGAGSLLELLGKLAQEAATVNGVPPLAEEVLAARGEGTYLDPDVYERAIRETAASLYRVNADDVVVKQWGVPPGENLKRERRRSWVRGVAIVMAALLILEALKVLGAMVMFFFYFVAS
ncbi:hypothetical protein M0E87_01125 [Corynebacterium sp. CCM 9185]|uniref:Uncharacterized protein n=1 Tax=Corynebacterium marambiense TaxID=2765364 RepID=A0ABS0VSV6_9CORY|nr:hypothetical protein [Corynebacterium marambiense]MBI8999436.1 hypothetical protein [Corynebacterium marambiense]MCK7662274.1 hypothetical protein [Corynebacterium marambiense]MCX7541542.1 hypothetical protein [Corynebacterium marambiense]